MHAPIVANSERASDSVIFLGLNGTSSFHRLSTTVAVVVVGIYKCNSVRNMLVPKPNTAQKY